MGGLGEATSIKLHDAGFAVVVTHSPNNTGTSSEWLAAMDCQGRNFRAYGVDVADYDSAQHCIAKVQREVGPIDILVNNAGITQDTTFIKKMSKVNWNAVLRTNLDSIFNMTKLVCEEMITRSWGRIINISSVNGSKGQGQSDQPRRGQGRHARLHQVARARSREERRDRQHDLAGLSRHQDGHRDSARDLDTKILPQIPAGRLGKPEEVAVLVAFLCSEDAGFVTGANIAINGGQHMH